MVHKGVYDSVIAGSEAGLDMAISTNGTVMNPDRVEDFLNALTWIRFNISAGESDAFALVMGTKSQMFDTVRKNVQLCVDVKNKFGIDVTIGMQMVLIKSCVDQIVPFAKLGRELGLDYAVIKQCSEHSVHEHSLVIDDYADHEDLFLEAESYSTDTYTVVVKRKKMAKKVRNYGRCYGCEFLPQITGAGDMYICGNWFGNSEYHLGNICETSFKDIVNSDHYRRVQKKVHKKIDPNTQCGIGCRQNEINEFLWKLKHPPRHINFI